MTLKLRGSPATTVTGSPIASTSAASSPARDPPGRGVQVCAAQKIGAERLGCLRRDDRGTIEGGRNPALLHLLHRVHAGYPGDCRSISARCIQDRPEHLGWGERTRSVVHRDPVVPLAAIDRGGDAVLTAFAALEEHDVRKPVLGGDAPNLLPARDRRGDGDEVVAPGGGDGFDGDREDRPPGDDRPELVLPRPYPVAEGGDDQRAGQRCATLARTGRSTRGLVESSAAIVAKIIRPAVVWSTVVTVTVTVSSTCSRPFSTTTMVPSSK